MTAFAGDGLDRTVHLLRRKSCYHCKQRAQRRPQPMEVFVRELFQSTRVRLFDEGGLKDLFDHVRNLLTATLIIASGSYAFSMTNFPDTSCWRSGLSLRS